MKTSVNETQQIEAYLLGGPADEAVVMEARLLVDEDLREKIIWQKKTHFLAEMYGRKKLRQEIDSVHRELFTSKKHLSFREKVLGFFRS